MSGELTLSQFRYTVTNNRDFVIGDPTDSAGLLLSKYLVFQTNTTPGYTSNPYIGVTYNSGAGTWDLIISKNGTDISSFAYTNSPNTFTNNTIFSGQVTFNNTTIFSNTSDPITFNSPIIMTSTLNVTGVTTLGNNLGITGNLAVSGSGGFGTGLNVSGNGTFNNNVTITGNLTVNGTTTIGSIPSLATVGKVIYVNSTGTTTNSPGSGLGVYGDSTATIASILLSTTASTSDTWTLTPAAGHTINLMGDPAYKVTFKGLGLTAARTYYYPDVTGTLVITPSTFAGNYLIESSSNGKNITETSITAASLSSLFSQISTLTTAGTITSISSYVTTAITNAITNALNSMSTAYVTSASLTATLTTSYYTSTTTTLAIASAISSLNATLAGTYISSATLTTNYSTTATMNSAIASAISTLSSTVGSNLATALTSYSTTTTMNSAISTATTNLSTSLKDPTTGLLATSTAYQSLVTTVGSLGGSAQWKLAMDVNGNVSGLDFTTVAPANGAPAASTFSVLANTFKVVDPTSPSVTITAGNFVIGTAYTIASVGSTNFTLIGAAANTVGTSFVATGVGSGSGTATIPNGFTPFQVTSGIVYMNNLISGIPGVGYQAGTYASPPVGFKLAKDPFTAHLLDGTDLSVNLELGTGASFGGYKVADVTNSITLNMANLSGYISHSNSNGSDASITFNSTASVGSGGSFLTHGTGFTVVDDRPPGLTQAVLMFIPIVCNQSGNYQFTPTYGGATTNSPLPWNATLQVGILNTSNGKNNILNPAMLNLYTLTSGNTYYVCIPLGYTVTVVSPGYWGTNSDGQARWFDGGTSVTYTDTSPIYFNLIFQYYGR